MNKVAVLMSTYNGHKYIREQIDSILTQKDVEIHLYIRDDGSTDKTIEIIKKYISKGSNITLYKEENVGVGNSFMNLVYSVGDFDYYAFADQDDIWLADKIKSAIEFIKDEKKAILYTSNQILVNSNLNNKDLRYKERPNLSYKQIICMNKYAGCTMVWNKEFQRMISERRRRPSKVLLTKRIHDVWFAMVAAALGSMFYDEKGYILYRQHENNVVGVRKTNIAKQWLCKLRDSNQRNGRSSLCQEILRCFGDLITDKEEKEYLSMIAYYKRSLKNRLKLACEKSLCKISGETRLMFALKVFAGLI